MTGDEGQHSIWTFYEVVFFGFYKYHKGTF